VTFTVTNTTAEVATYTATDTTDTVVVTQTAQVTFTAVPSGFTAYNDLAWASGQLTSNITTITSPNGGSGLPSSGQLVDFATGLPTPVSLTLTVSGGTFNGTSHATTWTGGPAAGTDAFNLFDGNLTAFGSLTYENLDAPAGNLVLTFDNLDPTKVYDLAFYGHRDKYAWNRAALVTLSGQAAFTNTSSVGTDDGGAPLFSGPGDPSTRLPADNDQGWVARFSTIDPGSDGIVVLTISYDGTSPFKGKYANAVRLVEE
jgi:hypothetical protein